MYLNRTICFDNYDYTIWRTGPNLAPASLERLRDTCQTWRLPSLERRGAHRTCWNGAACCFPPALGSKSLQIGFPVGAFLGTAVSWHGHQLQNVWCDAHGSQTCKSWLIHLDQCCYSYIGGDHGTSLKSNHAQARINRRSYWDFSNGNEAWDSHFGSGDFIIWSSCGGAGSLCKWVEIVF